MSSVTHNLRLGRYLLQERLAHGGFGEVYRAAAYGAAGVVKTVCVKRILAEKADRYWRVESFIEEARLSMQLSHTNIVSVFDFGVAEGGYYLAMEWVDGVDLMAFVRRGVRVPTALVAYVGAETCRALERAHRGTSDGGSCIVHRDVKPSNILLSRSGEVKLADFGIATLQGGQRSVAGTPGYMSPEQRDGATVDARADIFGLGVSLLEFSIGKRARDVQAALGEVRDADLRELLSWMATPELELRAFDAHQIGQEFERMVGRALAADEEHPRDILSAYVDSLAKLQITAPVDMELGGTASLLCGVDGAGRVRPVTDRIDRGDPGQREDRRDEEAPAPRVRWQSRIALGALALVLALAVAILLEGSDARESIAKGRLEVSAEPAAAIYVDGVRVGEGPAEDVELPAGEHEVGLGPARDDPGATRRVEVREGEAVRVDLTR